MKWSAPIVQEVCVGMEVTSYESAEIDPFNEGRSRVPVAGPADPRGRCPRGRRPFRLSGSGKLSSRSEAQAELARLGGRPVLQA